MACPLCELEERRPELLIERTASWTLAHVDRLFTPGALFLFPRTHTLTHELDADAWANAAPLLAQGTRLLRDVGSAERVYLCSFGEQMEHFHFVMLPRRANDLATYGGKKGAALFEAVAERGVHPSAAEIAEWVGRYRSALER